MVVKGAQGRVIAWLATGCILIFVMVLVGGITRLTGSGLSITEWKLISGVFPPMSDEAWKESFEAYQKIPQYGVQPQGFSLSDFKGIYWWEYIHRLLGRIIGIVFIVPYLYFLIRRRISKAFAIRLLILLLLGALQGLAGWYMVKSGLTERVSVSHYFLALHLVLALATFSYTWWLILSILFPQKREVPVMKTPSLIFLGLLSLQIVYGAFMAGLKAGLFYNTFPLMEGRWIPEGLFVLQPLWKNFTENVTMVQFIHRLLGMLLFFFSLSLWLVVRRKKEGRELEKLYFYLFLLTTLQALLGITTLLYNLPLSLAVMHQVGAFFILLSVLLALHRSHQTINSLPIR